MPLLTLDNLGHGAAKEKFNDALEKVIQNIKDENTEWKKSRKLSLVITFMPNEERSEVGLLIDAIPTLVRPKPFKSQALIGMHRDGKTEAQEYAKPTLPGCSEEETDGKVTQLRTEEAK